MADPMTGPAPRCQWCSAPLPSADLPTCPSCGAALTSATGPSEIRGVTTLDPEAILRARSERPRPRNRLLSFITGDVARRGRRPAEAGVARPARRAVRLEMLRLEIEAERADLEAETVALKTDVVAGAGDPRSRSSAAPTPARQRGDARRGPGAGESPPVASAAATGAAPRARTPAPRRAAPRRRATGRTAAGGAAAPRRPRSRARLPAPAAGILGLVPDRLPHPGPSYLREQDVRIGDRLLQAGMAKPVDGPDDWWLAVLWVTDDEGVVSFRDVAPSAGPPPEPPLLRLGPSFAGSPVRADPRGGRAARDPPHAARPARRRRPPVALPARDPDGVPVRAGPRRDAPAERARGAGADGLPPLRGGAPPA